MYKQKCKSTVVVYNSFKIINVSNTHDHGGYTDPVISREIIRSSVKRKANDKSHVMPNKLIRRNLQNMNDISSNLVHIAMKLLRRFIYDERRKHFSILPTSLVHAIDQIIQTQSTIQHKGEQFCFLSDENSIIYLRARTI